MSNVQRDRSGMAYPLRYFILKQVNFKLVSAHIYNYDISFSSGGTIRMANNHVQRLNIYKFYICTQVQMNG